ncbi:MAG TPA: hypothetical protein VFZ48_01925 [Candidatus Saccharimonadales bacterium]
MINQEQTLQTTSQTRALIDEITYLASLASDAHAIDPILDKLRVVTARLKPNEEASTEDELVLREVQKEIEQYLINRDSLRSFTDQTLTKNVQEQLNGKQQGPPVFSHAIGTVGTLILASIGASLVAFLVTFTLPLLFRTAMALTSFYATLYAGVIWLYLSSLRTFKPELKQAFQYVATGIVFTGTGVSGFALVLVLGLQDLPIFRYCGFDAFFPIAAVLFYIGLVKFAALLEIKTWLRSYTITAAIGLITAAAMFAVPHAPAAPGEDFFFYLSFVSLWLTTLFCAFVAILAFMIAGKLSSTLSRAMTMFGICQSTVSIGCAIAMLALAVGGTLPINSPLFLIIGIPFIATNILYVIAGHLFRKASLGEQAPQQTRP